ncbi:hypothetical protein EI982_13010 [Haloplanus rallus]|jgi:hypothetical protein|uniref:Uncharacterized protein n=1 Tax=Haloplanus rallus TaxID=1816183 RepID=A0A6B9FAE7_9EURY|nr:MULTISPECIES: hypothetical protein [Haloplanus]QGX95647.1 hypothetical protein EI982_13010 [Haloplanus rallus]
MPAKTGASHAMSAFVSLIVGTVLSKYVWTYTPPLAEAGAVVGRHLVTLIGVPLSRELTGGFVVVLALSFLWGVLYHVTRHGS